MLDQCVQLAKSGLRGPYRSARARYIRARFGFGAAELGAAIRQVGLTAGDAVLLHSGMAAFEGFDGAVGEIIVAFQDTVGAGGVLMMPTFSMSGSALEYARSGKVFNPRTTPSQSGLITEVFRRSPGVVRSLHPTHSVAVWGKDSEWWIDGHHLGGHPVRPEYAVRPFARARRKGSAGGRGDHPP